MTAKTQSPPKKGFITNLLWVGILGWLLLFGYTLSLWVSRDFDTAFYTIHHLSNTQARLASPYDSASHLMQTFITHTPLFPEQEIISTWETFAIDHGLHMNATLDGMCRWCAKFYLLLSTTNQVFLIKLAILIAAAPLFLLAITAGLIDGLSQRAIRTACLGRESTFVFHKSIPWMRYSFFWMLGLWLCLPKAIPPSPIFLSLSVFLGFIVSISASRFKKYL